MGHKQSMPAVDFDKEIYFTNARGQRIVCMYWKPETSSDNPRALVFIAHGVGEMCHWYGEIAEPLTKHNIAVFAHDHVGHGKSDGERVQCDKFSDYTEDIYQHVDMMKEKYGKDIPIFIVGHSMGGTVALKAAMDNPGLFKGVVLVGAGIQENPETVTPCKVMLAKWTASVLPQLQIGKIHSDWISRDPAVCQDYEESPWCWHGGLKAKWSVCMLDAMKHIQENMKAIKFPFFALHGDADLICMVSGSKLLADEASSSDKTLKIYPGGYHQLHNEPDGMGVEVVSDIVNWVTARL